MSQAVLSPELDELTGGTVYGAATHWQALSDSSDASYVKTSLSISRQYMSDFTLPAGAVTTSLVFRGRVASDSAGYTDWGVGLYVGGALVYDARSWGVTGTGIQNIDITGYTGSLSQAQINDIRLGHIQGIVSPYGKLYETRVFVNYITAPTAPTGVGVSGGSPVTTTKTPTYVWTHNGEGGQTKRQVKVFTDAVRSGGGFNVDTSQAVDDNTATTGSQSYSTGTSLINGGTYWVYARTASTTSSVDQWSPWSSGTSFTVTVSPGSPTNVSPTAGSTVTTPYPALDSDGGSAYGYTTKRQWQVASDSGFTTNVQLVDEGVFRSSHTGQPAYTFSGTALAQAVWYIRARFVDADAYAGSWTTAHTFTIAHLPVATPINPVGGQTVLYATSVYLDWTFTDAYVSDSQTAYQIEMWKASDKPGTVIDTGKVTSVNTFATVGTVDATWKNVDLRWRARLYDQVASSATSYSSKFASVAAQETTPTGVRFSADGTKMYVVGNVTNTVYQYTLATAWDVSTASYASKSFSVATQVSLASGMAFSADGTKMYVVGTADDTVYQYTLSTPWDVSTASYASKSFSVAAQDTGPAGMAFSADGTKMYISGSVTDTVYQYTLGTAWDLSTASYASKSLLVASQDGTVSGVTFSADGIKMHVCGTDTDAVYQYTLATAWDLSTASYASLSFSVAPQDTGLSDVTLSPDGTKIYISGNSTDAIYQYTTGTVVGAWSADTAFYLRDLPVVTITSPTDGGTVTSANPTITWTFSSFGGAQTSYRVIVTNTGTSAVVADSGLLSGANLSWQLPSPVIQLSTNYSVQVQLTDAAGLTGSDTNAFTATYVAPTTPTATISTTHFESLFRIDLDWSASTVDGNNTGWRIYRRLLGDVDWILVYDGGTVPAVKSYGDYTAPSNRISEYAVVQVINDGFGGLGESSRAPIQVDLVGMASSYALVVPDDPGFNVPLYHVTADSFSDEHEMSMQDILGKGRKPSYGTRFGQSGSLAALLRDNDEMTARQQRLWIEAIRNSGLATYLRTPFGDVWRVALLGMSASRVAGLGVQSEATVSIEYTEVSA